MPVASSGGHRLWGPSGMALRWPQWARSGGGTAFSAADAGDLGQHVALTPEASLSTCDLRHIRSASVHGRSDTYSHLGRRQKQRLIGHALVGTLLVTVIFGFALNAWQRRQMQSNVKRTLGVKTSNVKKTLEAIQEEAPPIFMKILNGTCTAAGSFPITDKASCEDAARHLGLQDIHAMITHRANRPEGCYYYEKLDKTHFNPIVDALWLSVGESSRGKGAEVDAAGERFPICMWRQCSTLQDNMDYWTKVSLYVINNVPSAFECLKHCESETKCGAWTWGKQRNLKGLTDVCFLKELDPGAKPQKNPKVGVISGTPCRDAKRLPTVSMTTSPKITTSSMKITYSIMTTSPRPVTSQTSQLVVRKPAVATPLKEVYPKAPHKSSLTLFCFSVMRAKGYELSLMRSQLEHGVGIFACDEWRVLSDEKIWLSPGPPVKIETTVIPDANLESPPGAKTHFLNTGVFLQAWQKISTDTKFKKSDWVVKVDPDAVFFPKRLLEHIHAKAPGRSVNKYFLNCHFDKKLWMFGAIEVISKTALEIYFQRGKLCEQTFKLGDMGEDTWMKHCLDLLGVDHVVDLDLLSDGYCHEAPSTCKSGKVAFHPFKDAASYMNCVHSAEQ